MPSSINISLTDLPDLELLKGKESELNWEARDRLLHNLTVYFTEQRGKLDYSLAGMSNFSGSFADLRASFQALPANDARFVISGWIKNYYDDIMLILHTPRTQLSIRTCNFISAFASFLGPGLFDTFAEISLNHLIKLSGTTKKIIANTAADVAKNISTLIVPQRAFPVLLNGANDKNVNSRLRAFECLKILSERNYEENSAGTHQKIWENAVEKVLQKGIGDANAEIRSVALNIFLIYKDRTTELVNKFMEKLDPSTKKQLNLLLAKTSSSSTPKQSKPIVSTVPLAQIRKTMLKTNDETVVVESPVRAPSPLKTSPTKTKLSPSKSNYELSSTPTIQQQLTKSRLSPSKSNYDCSPSKKLSPTKSVSTFATTDVPMDKISIPLASPTSSKLETFGSPMKINRNYATGSDVFMDAQSHSGVLLKNCEESEDEEIILNVPNVIKTSMPSTPREVEELANELPQKIRFEPASTIFDNSFVNSPVKRFTPHSCSTPSVPSRIKSLGLAAGTPLRAIYQNSSNPEIANITTNHQFWRNNNSLLNDLIEEFCNTKDEECFKKILALTANRTGDYDGLTSNLVHKLFVSSIGIMNSDLTMKLLTNFLNNESFLLSLSGREIIEILEEQYRTNPDNTETTKTVAKSNLVTILIENCIEMCCERLSEFKLILLAEFIRNFIGTKEVLKKSITPLVLALNHPNLNFRRLSINCFIEVRNKLDRNTENVMELLDENRVGVIQKRIIEGFLNQF